MQQHLDRQRGEACRELIYPWNEIENSRREITLVGFGSLINVTSAQRTLQASFPHSSKPCVVFGARRLYNRVMSDRGYRNYGQEQPRTPMAVLNVHATGRASDYFNGVLLTLKPADLEAFRTREHGYDLIPVCAVPFDSPHERPQQVYCLASRNTYLGGRRVLSNMLEPQPRYHALCEEGCAAISPQFLDVFRHTTWVCTPDSASHDSSKSNAKGEPAFATPPV